MNQDKDKIIIRDASYEDAKFIIDANLAMAKEVEKIDLDYDTLTKGVKAVFRDHGKGRYIIGEINGQIAGCMLITLEWSDWRNKQVGWIQSLYVVPEHRSKGIFRAMFATLEERVKQGEYAGLRLYVDTSNGAAKEVYQNLGMNGDHYEMFEKMGCSES